MSTKLYTIQQGAHYANKRFPKPFNSRVLRFTACFIKDCWYDTEKHGTHINKLYGFSTDVLNNSSIRIGWRPAKEEGVFELYSYLHYGGKYVRSAHLKDDLIGTVSAGEDVYLAIHADAGSVRFMVKDTLSKAYFYPVNVPCLGWVMYPYFGGTSTAPQTMYIQINLLENY